MTTFYERQINTLREEKATAEETIEMEREMHENSLKATNRWYTEYQNADKPDLLKRVVELEEEKKKLIPKELSNKIEAYEKEITELKEQLAQFTSQKQTTQIEIPTKRQSY